MQAEITRIYERNLNNRGTQYSLRATITGVYPCFNCPNGTRILNAGEVWKFGETINPNTRYPESFLSVMKVRQVNEFYGSQIQIKVIEKSKIYGYFFTHGHLPPGNRIFR